MKKFTLLSVLIYLVSALTVDAQVNITFNALADMTSKRYGMGYTCDGKNIYAFTGGTNISPYYSSSMEIYNIENNTWTEIRNDLIPRRYGSAEYISSQNKIYIFNGLYYGSNSSIAYTDTIEIYDVNTKELSYRTSNPYPVRYAGSAVWNNKIYVFGGSNANGPSNRLYVYDPANDQWTRLADMPEAKQTSGRIVDGILYVFGGYNGSVTSTRIDAYDIQTNTWSSLGNMPIGVSSHATAVSGKYIWLVGSYTDLQLLATFNTETHTFTQLSSNMTGRRHAAAVVVGNNLYIYGGAQTSHSTSALRSLEFADISDYVVSIKNDYENKPQKFYLSQNYPNPFNPSTVITYYLSTSEHVNLSLYNVLGQKIKTLVDEKQKSGAHSISFVASGLASGIYIYKLSINDYTQMRKMVYTK